MQLIDRYITRNVILATCFVVATLVGLEIFILFFSEASFIGKAHYTIFVAFAYVLMQLPFHIYQLFPMGAFLGSLIGLGKLASSSELIVMRSSGISIVRITFSVIKAAIIMLIFITIMGETIAPQIDAYSERMRSAALDQPVTEGAGSIWLRDKNIFIHFGRVLSNTKVAHITGFGMNDNQLVSAFYSPLAVLLPNHQWQLTHVVQSDLSQDRVTTRAMPTKNLNLRLNPVVVALGSQNVDQLTLNRLYEAIKYRRQADLDVEQYQFAFWQRLLQPLVTIVMICLGVPFIFGSLRSASMGLRILVGIIVGFAFYVINQLLGPIAVVYQISPIIAALIPLVIFVVVCAILYRRV